MDNAPPGHELFRDYDEHGPVLVYQADNRRILSFGNHVEQSCVWTNEPTKLTYAYTQVMMLALLLVSDAPHMDLLGLGGGSMVRCLLGHVPDCQVTAIERRQLVVDIAHRFFDLPVDPRLTIHVGEALDYLRAAADTFDLLFADLYDAHGMDLTQTEEELLARSCQRLSDGGVMVFNLWNADYASAKQKTTNIKLTYPYVAHLTVLGGNRLLFAFHGEPPALLESRWADAAQAQGLRMNIPLLRFARAFWSDNHELFTGDSRSRRKAR